jgi:hypothetical protein
MLKLLSGYSFHDVGYLKLVVSRYANLRPYLKQGSISRRSGKWSARDCANLDAAMEPRQWWTTGEPVDTVARPPSSEHYRDNVQQLQNKPVVVTATGSVCQIPYVTGSSSPTR